MNIVVDPYLIAIPQGNDLTTEQVMEYAARLSTWEKEFSAHPRKYVLSEWAWCAICNANLAPNTGTLKALFARFGVNKYYSAEDIAPACGGVLENTPFLEERVGVNDVFSEVECNPGTEMVIPDEIRARIPHNIAEEFTNALLYSSYALNYNQREVIYSIATAPLQNDQSTKLQVAATFSDVYGATKPVNSEWPLLFDPEYIYLNYDINDYYLNDPLLAVKIAWCKLKSEVNAPLKGIDLSKLVFREEFISSLQKPRIHQRPEFHRDIERVFEGIVYAVENLWSYGGDKHHALRKNVMSRTSPQQTRNRNGVRERAARIEIIAGVNCLHLHYWQCADGSYEFSNLTDIHDDPTILGGD